jgi:multicomponent Na+:H+ antiporter subunit C
MILPLSILIGLMFGSAVYCLLRRSLMRVLIGILLLSHAVNLLLMSASTPISGIPGIIGPDGKPAEVMADPLPQALVLTAVVIGFGLCVFSLVLARSVFLERKDDDMAAFGKEDSQ